MPQDPATLMDHILQQSRLLVAWVLWLIVINTASLLFVRHVEAETGRVHRRVGFSRKRC